MSSPLSDDARVRAADLFEAHAGALCHQLQRRFPHLDSDVIADAVTGAILQLALEPQRFDPAKGSIRPFLWGIARRLLSTHRRGEQRRRAREQKKVAGAVTDRSWAANSSLKVLSDQEEARRLREQLACTPEEEAVLMLMLDGVKELGRYVEALGIAHLPPAEQERRVQKVQARLRQRMARLRRLHEEDNTP
jgi:DNA-directed RNA polymerase specialized sigma24 family protein